ncbi:MAG: NAD(P)H-binding protein [Deltaproteobacteria bacterium]|nr:NAD(P)H-binding protein [Deltaproteobacteria bacterium]
MTTPLHVVVGAGQVGPLIVERLLARGLRVRVIRRGSAPGPARAGVDTVRADVSDPRAAADAMRGASVVYHTGNPRYDRWPAELLPLTRGIIAGATRAGARLVVLDNLYMYDLPSDGHLSEDTAIGTRSKKGHLRALAAAELLAAHARGDLPVAIARASDFIGPGAPRTIFSDRFWKRLFAGKSVEAFGDPDQPHSLSYTPDVADGLVTLGSPAAEATGFGRVWHLPAGPAETPRVWMSRLAAAVGRTPRIVSISPLLLRAVGLFMPEAREVPEMLYQWRQPFILDDRRFRAAFGADATPVATVVAETAAWGRSFDSAVRTPVAA